MSDSSKKFAPIDNKPRFQRSVSPIPAFRKEGELVLIRGLPGSGKTTMAKVLALVDYQHFEADMFFELNGPYLYDSTRIRDAHAWCLRMTKEALQQGKRAVVSNTFVRLWEMDAYRSLIKNCRIIEACGKWQNQHGVPTEVVEKMANRWESLQGQPH
ncbi:MAG: AAA family ATPase [Rhodoferax sp.]